MLLLQVGLACLFVAAGVAAAGESLLPLATPAPDLRPVARFLLGLAAWILGLFALATAGWLGPAGVVAMALGLAAPGALRRWRRRSTVLTRPDEAPEPLVVRLLVAVVAVGLLAPLALLAATPPVGWDDGVYHLALPRLFLEAGGFRPVPFNVYAAWPLGAELLWAAAMAVGPHPAAKLLHFGFGLLVLFTLRVALRDRGLLAGATAGALVIANPVVVVLARVAYVDLAIAFFLLAGVLFVRRGEEDPASRQAHLALAGVAGGLAVATKVTGFVVVAVLAALLLPGLVRTARAGRAAAALGDLARFAVPVAALGAPWWARTWLMTGNPLYPFLHGLLGGPWWSERLTAQLVAWQRSIGMGRDPVDFLLLPFRVFVAGGEGYARFDGRLSPVWVVLLPATLVLGLSLSRVRWALAAAGLAFVAWAATAQQMRFLAPALPLLALAVVDTASARLARLAPPLRRRLAIAGFLAAAALVAVPQRAVLAAGWRTLPVLLAGDPATLLGSAVPEVWRFVDRTLPQDARLLLLGTNRVFDCRREAIADSFFEASQITDWLADAPGPAEVLARLRAAGVTHVVVEHRPGPAYPPALLELLADPGRARSIFRSPDGRHEVLELAEGPL